MIRSSVERVFPYPITRLFAVVADIDAYPLYMPGWRVVRVIERSPTRLKVEQTVGAMGLWATFVSNADADPPHRLDIRSKRPPFRWFHLRWLFHEQSADITLVRAELEVAFRSPVLERLIAGLMPIMLKRVVDAFRRRAVSSIGRADVGGRVGRNARRQRSSALKRSRSKRRGGS